jgi:hypothetical protein
MGALGMPTNQFGQPCDGVAMDPEQSRDLADPQPFAEMVQDLQDRLVRELGVE